MEKRSVMSWSLPIAYLKFLREKISSLSLNENDLNIGDVLQPE